MRAAQGRLRESAGVPDTALFLADEATSMLVYANGPGLAVLGRPADEILRLALLDITARSSRAALVARLERLRRGNGDDAVLELSLLRRDGNEQPARVRLERIALPDKRLIAMLVLHGGAGAGLAGHETGERAGERAFGDFIARLGHDFNNLLSTIVGSLGLLRGELRESAVQDHTEQLIEDALSAGRECADLVNRLLAAAGRQALRPRAVQVNDVVAGLARLLGRTLPAGIELKVALAAELPEIVVDPDALESALLDVAVNAREAMPEGGSLEIETHESKPDDPDRPQLPGDGAFVEIRVADEGGGIPEDLRHRVLEPLFSTKRSGAGRGLGLSVARGFASQSAGALHVESIPGRGTRVRFFLPV